MARVLLLLLCTVLASCATGRVAGGSKQVPTNARLAALFEADQAARGAGTIDWEEVSKRDQARRTEVLSIIKGGELHTAADYYHAAMVLQHGESSSNLRVASSVACLGSVLDPNDKDIRWLSAVAWDRFLIRKNMPQRYGTQYSRPVAGAPGSCTRLMNRRSPMKSEGV